MSLLQNIENSMIFSYLTPIPKGENMKIIELGSPPFGEKGQGLFEADSIF
jgi:hypothetical protein